MIYLYDVTTQEAISKAEEAHHKEAMRVLGAACPAAAPRAAAGRAWLQAFADNLNKELLRREAETLDLEKKNLELEKKASQKVAPVAAPQTQRLEELQSEKEHLQGLVDKYKLVIDSTVRLFLPGNKKLIMVFG